MRKPKRKPNTTEDGALACAFGTPWLDHFGAPIGTGKGCRQCDDETERDEPDQVTVLRRGYGKEGTWHWQLPASKAATYSE